MSVKNKTKELRTRLERIISHEMSTCCDDGCSKWDSFHGSGEPLGGRYILTDRECNCGAEEKIQKILEIIEEEL